MRGTVTQLHGAVFGVVNSVLGVGILAAFVNPLVAVLGASNIVLYAGIYTPLKRLSIANTVC